MIKTGKIRKPQPASCFTSSTTFERLRRSRRGDGSGGAVGGRSRRSASFMLPAAAEVSSQKILIFIETFSGKRNRDFAVAVGGGD